MIKCPMPHENGKMGHYISAVLVVTLNMPVKMEKWGI
jgi:hypothetical protein